MKRIYDNRNDVELRQAYSAEKIASAVERLASDISADYAGKELMLVVVLNGAFIFAADLVRKLKLPIHLDFVRLASYEGMESNGNPAFTGDLRSPVKGKHLLVVEDIVDTGLSLSFLLHDLKKRDPASLKVCALIDKRERRRVDVSVDYAGITCDHGFLVGYGLDLNGGWRELPAIYHAEQYPRRRAE